MDTKPETIIVELESLIQAIIEVEHQEDIRATLLLDCIDRLKAMTQLMEAVLVDYRISRSRYTLQELFLPSAAWGQIFSDERLAQWQTEAKAIIAAHEKDFLPPVPDTLCPASSSGVPADTAVPRQSEQSASLSP